MFTPALDPVLVQRLENILLADPWRVACLEAAHQVMQAAHYPDYLLAAGFVRNAVWDALHGFAPSSLSDIDLVYFGEHRGEGELAADVLRLKLEETKLTQHLNRHFPASWEVKNQRRMHLRHKHAPYHSLAAAMAHWPEQETAVGVRLDDAGKLHVVAPWGLESLFALTLTRSPLSDPLCFNARLGRKHWLTSYPGLTISR